MSNTFCVCVCVALRADPLPRAPTRRGSFDLNGCTSANMPQRREAFRGSESADDKHPAVHPVSLLTSIFQRTEKNTHKRILYAICSIRFVYRTKHCGCVQRRAVHLSPSRWQRAGLTSLVWCVFHHHGVSRRRDVNVNVNVNLISAPRSIICLFVPPVSTDSSCRLLGRRCARVYLPPSLYLSRSLSVCGVCVRFCCTLGGSVAAMLLSPAPQTSRSRTRAACFPFFYKELSIFFFFSSLSSLATFLSPSLYFVTLTPRTLLRALASLARRLRLPFSATFSSKTLRLCTPRSGSRKKVPRWLSWAAILLAQSKIIIIDIYTRHDRFLETCHCGCRSSASWWCRALPILCLELSKYCCCCL